MFLADLFFITTGALIVGFETNWKLGIAAGLLATACKSGSNYR